MDTSRERAYVPATKNNIACAVALAIASCRRATARFLKARIRKCLIVARVRLFSL